MTFWEHVEELRLILIRSFFVVLFGTAAAFFFIEDVFKLATYPLHLSGGGKIPLVILGPVDGFSSSLKLAFWTSGVLTFPYWGFLFLKFLHPALHAEEKKAVAPFFILSFFFLSIGLIFSYSFTIPLANKALYQFNLALGKNLWSLQNYIDYALTLVFATCIVFESAVILFILVHYGWVFPGTLMFYRREVILASFVISALLTPPDILTQILLALPLILLYEMVILYGRVRFKKFLYQ